MNPTDRSNVGNTPGGSNVPPADAVQDALRQTQPAHSKYDPIFSPSGMASANTNIYKQQPQPQAQPATTPPPQPTSTPGEFAGQPLQISSTTPELNSNHTSSTATGDIILQQPSQSPSTKSRLPIIALIIAIVILIGAGLFILIANPFKGAPTADKSTVASFNQFMNYLYDGSDATGVNKDAYSESATFKFEEMLDSTDQAEKTEYFTTAQQLLNAIESNSTSQNENRELINEADVNLALLSEFANVNILSDDDIIAYYKTHTSQNTKDYIKKHYQPLSSSDNSDAARYAQSFIDFQVWLVDVFDYARSVNCFSSDGISQSCTIELPSNLATNQEALNQAFLSAKEAKVSSVVVLISDVQKLGHELNGQIDTNDTGDKQ